MARLILFIVVFFVAGCTTVEEEQLRKPEVRILKSTFDPAAAQYALRPGTGTITGRLLGVSPDGSPLIGPNADIRLIPQTDYARDYLKAAFGSRQRRHVIEPVKNVDPQFRKFQRFATGDKDGNFTLYGVPAGAYFLLGVARRRGGNFAVYEPVSIAKGQKLDLALDGK